MHKSLLLAAVLGCFAASTAAMADDAAAPAAAPAAATAEPASPHTFTYNVGLRSEERRVGKECRL